MIKLSSTASAGTCSLAATLMCSFGPVIRAASGRLHCDRRCESDGPFLCLAVFQEISPVFFNSDQGQVCFGPFVNCTNPVWMLRKTSLLLQRRLHSNGRVYLLNQSIQPVKPTHVPTRGYSPSHVFDSVFLCHRRFFNNFRRFESN